MHLLFFQLLFRNEFKSITALNKYMTELSDDDFELFVEHILKIIENEKNA
jgi:hypothetical protein